jgi:hypothetical protein
MARPPRKHLSIIPEGASDDERSGSDRGKDARSDQEEQGSDGETYTVLVAIRSLDLGPDRLSTCGSESSGEASSGQAESDSWEETRSRYTARPGKVSPQSMEAMNGSTDCSDSDSDEGPSPVSPLRCIY